MKEVLEKIRIIPLGRTLRSEDVIRRQARRLANYIEHDGMQRDPIVVVPDGDRYIALDGMHRVEALKVMKCRDLLAYVVDYDNDGILLESWDALVYECPDVHGVLEEEFRGSEYTVERIEGTGRDEVMERRGLFSVVTKEGTAWSVRRGDRPATLDELIDVLVRFERRLDAGGARIRYVPNTDSDHLFAESRSAFLVIRPRFTKREVRERTLQGKLFPRKTTRHVIDKRPLRVGVALSILKQDTDIDVKNDLLQAELRWKHERGRIRFYPEPIILFDE